MQNISGMISRMDPSQNDNITFNSTFLLYSNWTIYGFNVMMKKTKLSHIIIDNVSENKRLAIISWSTFKHITCFSGYKISISGYFINATSMFDKTLINLRNCNLIMVNSSFGNITKRKSGPAIINGVESKVSIQNIKVIENYASNGLIQIQNGSQLHIENSTFESNGHSIITSAVILVKLNSSVFINNSTFNHNAGLYGACLYCYQNTTVIINNTNFYENIAVKGGAIFCKNTNQTRLGQDLLTAGKEMKRNNSQNRIFKSTFIIRNSILAFDLAWLDGGAFYFQGPSIRVRVSDCKVSGFASREGGGLYFSGVQSGGDAEYVERSHLEISDSFFDICETWGEGCGIKAVEHCTILINNSTFSTSLSLWNAAIQIHSSVALTIVNSKFYSLRFPVSGAFMSSTGKCNITVIQCYFANGNTIPSYTVVFILENSTSLTAINSVFDSPPGYGLSVLSASQDVQIVFNNCTFNRISGFMALHNTSVLIENSRITGCSTTFQPYAFVDDKVSNCTRSLTWTKRPHALTARNILR